MAAHPDSLNDPILDICEAIKSINRKLGSMPGFKLGTPWHGDRVAEREHFQKMRARRI